MEHAEKLTDDANIKSVYIAGPITGITDANKEGFNSAAEKIKNLKLGIKVINPSELDDNEVEDTAKLALEINPGDDQWNKFLIRDIKHVLAVDAIIAIEDWQLSRGAKLEIYIAVALGKRVFHIRDLEIIPFGELPKIEKEGNILDEAQRKTGVDRVREYGHPAEDFDRAAKMISAIIGHEVQDWQVPLIQIACKISHFISEPNKSSLANSAAYMRTLEMLAQEKNGFHKLKRLNTLLEYDESEAIELDKTLKEEELPLPAKKPAPKKTARKTTPKK